MARAGGPPRDWVWRPVGRSAVRCASSVRSAAVAVAGMAHHASATISASVITPTGRRGRQRLKDSNAMVLLSRRLLGWRHCRHQMWIEYGQAFRVQSAGRQVWKGRADHAIGARADSTQSIRRASDSLPTGRLSAQPGSGTSIALARTTNGRAGPTICASPSPESCRSLTQSGKNSETALKDRFWPGLLAANGGSGASSILMTAFGCRVRRLGRQAATLSCRWVDQAGVIRPPFDGFRRYLDLLPCCRPLETR